MESDNIITWDTNEAEMYEAYAAAAEGAEWRPVDGARTNTAEKREE